MKPKLAAFPKCYIDELCAHQTMTLFDWIEMASTLGVDGLEFYSGFLKDEPAFLEGVKDRLQQIDSPFFAVNFDPSNTVLAGGDPIQLLTRVKHRVVSMHASDRYLMNGTLEDLRKEENEIGCASRLAHGVIGKGVNDYDAIFTILSEAGFHAWISIERYFSA
jgi:hypothetical protein